MKEISGYAFDGCSKIESITIPANAIWNIAMDAVIRVPGSKLEDYKKLFNENTGYKATMSIQINDAV